MIDVAGGFQYKNLYVFPAGALASEDHPAGTGDNVYNYLPITPEPETSPAGRPTLTNIPLGQGGLLQLGTRLEAKDETLEALRKELAGRLGLAEPSQVTLDMAPLQVKAALLEVGDGTGTFTEAGHSDTSGFPPYTALFSLHTDANQQNAVVAALNGRARFLQVWYETNFFMPARASAHVEGDVRDIVSHIQNASSEEDPLTLARDLLEEAIASGKISVRVEASEGTPEDLSKRAIEQAKEHLLQRLLIQTSHTSLPDLTHAKGSAELSESIEQPLQLVTDVADWFDGHGAGHVLIPPGS